MKRHIAATTLAVTVAAVTASSADAAFMPCADVPYTPGTTVSSSHYGAHTVRAEGTSCVTARRLALRAKNRGAFSYLGFRCTWRGTEASKPWHCYRPRPSAVVKFITIGN